MKHRLIRYLKNIRTFLFYEPRWFIQRARRGYSDKDVWNFDNYLARVMSGGLAQLRDESHGHPLKYTEDEWDAELTKASEALSRYVNPVFDPGNPLDNSADEAGREAMRWVAENFVTLWD